ncbi:hypothetical protein [Streptomyces lonegramiae]|uniref:Uncharacterized protein n=1 Tax=Streptomyces lonegramiae TaxID=3075524 RepID=A0ABU2XES7_9ACTN|nr:hypothetical protein [Streptomyces sp. DSM 41529]MDT0544430.1 hypothetical protein [Streptomyces sp. DSM 41529]
MAHDAALFIRTLGFDQVDLLGLSFPRPAAGHPHAGPCGKW